MNPSSAGTVPASVTIPANATSATFTFTADANASGNVDVVATLGAVSRTVSVAIQNMCSGAAVVISQVYGGGGNNGAPYKNDFIELHNRGGTAVDISGWSVQYASATGSTWNNKADIPANTMLQPGAYFLIHGAGGSNGIALPTADLAPANAINLSGTNGKVALVNNTTALAGTCPTDASIVDFVGFGNANCKEGSAAMAVLSNTTAGLRNNNGCSDSNDNAADFTAAAPTPRNTASATLTCGCN